MPLYLDADACPVPVRELLVRAAERAHVLLYVIANSRIPVPHSPWIRSFQVAAGFDEADRYIISQVQSGDLVITADIPLAAEVISKGAEVLTFRGDLLTVESIQERLSTRNLMQTLRDAGLANSSAPPPSLKERQRFAGILDHYLQKSGKT